jgi:uncharacterized protein with NAD-binding domain and iron-sulfur cluster
MNLWEAVIYSATGNGYEGSSFARLLNAPTNEAWIDPWIIYLEQLGVRFHVGHTVEALVPHGGRLGSVRVRTLHGRHYHAKADWYVCSVPVERAQGLLDRALLRADPELEAINAIQTRWMNGIQFFLRKPTPINHGHVAYVDSPWVVSSISQAQFWARRDFPRDYGDGQAYDCLSAVVSDWNQPGILYGKPARDCTRDEIATEIWGQMKAALNNLGEATLTDDLIHTWFLDPAIQPRPHATGMQSNEPLFIETPGLWDQRPDPTTAIPNLLLAADYVRNRSPIDTASMDGANAAARAAVNALLQAACSHAQPVPLYEPHTAPEFQAAKQLDAERYRAGQPHLLDGPWPNHPAVLDQLEGLIPRPLIAG